MGKNISGKVKQVFLELAVLLIPGLLANAQNRVPSLNRIMFGEFAAWLYKSVIGIMPDLQSPGFKNVILKPVFAETLDWAEGYHDSPYGRIELKWRRENGKITCSLTVPANSTATLSLPVSKGNMVSESGKEITGNKYITVIKDLMIRRPAICNQARIILLFNERVLLLKRSLKVAE